MTILLGLKLRIAGFAAVFLHLLIRVMGLQIPWNWQLWQLFLLMGVLNNVVPFSLIVWGQTVITGGLAAILNATTPFFAILLAHYATQDEKATSQKLMGLLLGFVGVVLIIGPDVLGALKQNVVAQLAILAAAMSYACASVFGKRFQRYDINPLFVATGQLTASTLLLLPCILLIDQPWQLVSPQAHVWVAVIALSLLSTAFAYILYFRLLATVGATNLMLVTLKMSSRFR